MRFLYGDSAPFPLGYNFLATLEIFMTTATRIVQLEQESRETARHIEEAATARIKGLEALEQFHTVVMRAVQDTAQKVQHAHALDYAARVAEFASGYVDNHRRAASGASERETQQGRSENEKRTAEQRQQLEVFLKAARLPVASTRYSLRLAGEGREARHHMSAVFDNPDGIQTVFKLDASRVPAWSMPRKVSEFVQGVELMVGVDKSWLRGTVTPKQVNVDEWIVTQVEMSDEAFELAKDAKVGIAHRLELGDALAGTWGQVFADYEILQPFEQLARGVAVMTEEDRVAKTLDRVKTLKLPTGKVLGLDSRGWRRGPPQDGGVVCWYEKHVQGGLTVSMDLDPGIFTGIISESPEQTLGSITISKGGGGWYAQDKALPLGDLPPIVFSELVRDLESLRS